MERLIENIIYEKTPTVGDIGRTLQDAATHDAERRGAGQAVLESKGCAWVAVKNRLELHRLPEAGECFTVSTWPLKDRLGLYPRQYEMRNADGELLVSCEALWAIMDIEDRTMLPGSSRGIEFIEEDGHPGPMRKVRVPEGGWTFTLVPTAEQIDFNGHMNNVAYIDAITEYLPESYQGHTLLSVAIDYEHELPAGQSAEVRAVPQGDSIFFEGTVGDKCCFRMMETFLIADQDDSGEEIE